MSFLPTWALAQEARKDVPSRGARGGALARGPLFLSRGVCGQCMHFLPQIQRHVDVVRSALRHHFNPKGLITQEKVGVGRRALLEPGPDHLSKCAGLRGGGPLPAARNEGRWGCRTRHLAKEGAVWPPGLRGPRGSVLVAALTQRHPSENQREIRLGPSAEGQLRMSSLRHRPRLQSTGLSAAHHVLRSRSDLCFWSTGLSPNLPQPWAVARGLPTQDGPETCSAALAGPRDLAEQMLSNVVGMREAAGGAGARR